MATKARISLVRPSQRTDSSLAAESALVAELPVSSAIRERPSTPLATPFDAVAAHSALRAISCVAAPCSSTEAATEPVMPLIAPIVLATPPIAVTALLVSAWIALICASISSVAFAVCVASSFTLTEPFDAALVDDARVYHGVTPVEPLDPAAPAYRDVLVVTFRRA